MLLFNSSLFINNFAHCVCVFILPLGNIYTDKQPVALNCLACEFVKLRGACNFASLSVMHQVFFLFICIFFILFFILSFSFFMTIEHLLFNSLILLCPNIIFCDFIFDTYGCCHTCFCRGWSVYYTSP